MLLIALVSLVGCGQRDAADVQTSPDAVLPSGDAPTEPHAPEVAEEAPPPTAAQRAALDMIKSAGGHVECDADGLPVLIDLASDRVFADSAAVGAVLAFPELQKLRLAVSTVEPDTIVQLASLKKLTEFLLQDAPIDDEALEKLLGAMPSLRRLTLRRLSKVTDAGTAAVALCPQVEVLALIEMNQVTGASLDHAKQLPHLRSLDLRNCGQLSIGDLEKLETLEGLEELKIGGPMANDEALAVVVQLPALRSLTIEDGDVTSEGLQRLAESPDLADRLRSLSFARCFGVTDESLAVLGQFPNLETVALRDIMVSGSFLETLHDSPLPLKTLVATQAFLTDESLAHLASVAPNLIHLDLRGNLGVTDASVEQFKKLESLEVLRLEETGVTSQLESTPGSSAP
jgi:hypothetical protein